MSFKESLVFVGDNSGARRAKQIGVLGSSQNLQANIGNFVIVAIPHRRLERRLIIKNIYLALMVTCNKNHRRLPGYFVLFATNKVVLFSEQGKVVGTRLYGPISQKIREKNIFKIVTLAKKIV
jgi:large subunit ribosomal protein L14